MTKTLSNKKAYNILI